MPLRDLNAPQRQAILTTDAPLLVLAGAGSGKTRVITFKIAHLIQENIYQASQIAAITFTNKAAKEMLERVNKLMPASLLKGITVSTFHSLGMSILRKEAALLGYKPQFSIFDSYDCSKIIADLLKATAKEEVRHVQNQISRWKNDFLTPEQALSIANSDWELICARLYLQYQDTLMAYQAMDFDDLIRLPVELFRNHSEALIRWQAKLRYLLIDEYQDTNNCQYELVKLLTGSRARFTAVGDDDQSIYAWRGANVENLARLQTDFHSLQIIKLEQNYRSTARILRAANSVISNNPKLFQKQLWSELGLGEHIHLIRCKNEDDEAATVVQRLQAHMFEHKTRYLDYAILYRGNYQAKLFEQALRQVKIPYQMNGGESFFDKPEIKDIIAYLKIIQNSDDDPSFIRALTTPKRGVGTTTLNRLGAWAGDRHKSLFSASFDPGFRVQIQDVQLGALETFCLYINRLQERANTEDAGTLLMEILTTIEYDKYLLDSEESAKVAENKYANVLDFVAWIDKKGKADQKNLIELTQTLALMSLLEGKEDGEVDAVKLSTLHASKGLEYPYVYLVGCEEGILPHRESIEQNMIEEERRLMYVGITRAQRHLTLSYCIKRKRAGEWQFIEASRFLDEIDASDLIHFGKPGQEPVVSKSEGKSRLQGLLSALDSKNKANL